MLGLYTGMGRELHRIQMHIITDINGGGGTHGSIKYGPIRFLYFFNREVRITDNYLRPLSESYINI